MPFKANADRRHHIPKQRQKVTNWAEYDAGLRARGSLTVWFTAKAIEGWRAETRIGRGSQARYSDLAIATALTLRAGFRLALRLAIAPETSQGSGTRASCAQSVATRLREERMLARRQLLVSVGAGALWRPAIAQPSRPAWLPTRPIQCIVGFAPGGGADQIARSICEGAAPLFPQPLVVTNRPGAGGAIAAQYVTTQPPDGHTLLMAGGSESTSLPAFRSLPYDPKHSFRAIMRLMRQRLFIIGRADGRFTSLARALAAAKEQSGTVSYGTSGVGSIPHAAFLVLERAAGVEMIHSPYTGGAPSVQAVAAGQIDLAGAHPEEFRGLADSGLIRVLAVVSLERAPQYPNAPTLKELGYDAVIENMKGWVAPAGTPDEVVTELHDRFRRAMTTPVWRAFLERAGDTDSYLPGVDFQAAMDRLLDTVRTVARST